MKSEANIEALRRAARDHGRAQTEEVVPVGKYRGRHFAEVREMDADYCRWVLEEAPDGALKEFAQWLQQFPPPAPGAKVYLVVPFASRDEAKRLGARWDRDRKLWFAPGEKGHEDLLESFPRFADE